jgi:hypothetical protein
VGVDVPCDDSYDSIAIREHSNRFKSFIEWVRLRAAESSFPL